MSRSLGDDTTDAAATQKPLNSKLSPRIKAGWFKKLSLFSGLELVSRVLQMLGALLVVRFLAKDEYAWYSLAIGFQGMVGFLTMIGAGAALFSMGGPIVNDRKALGGLVRAVKSWRWRLMAFSLPVVLPIFAILLYRNACPPLLIALLLLLACGMMWLEIQRHLLAAPLELAMRFNLLQKVEVIAAVVRLLALGVLIGMMWMNAASVLLVSTLLVGWIPLILLPKRTAEIADPESTAPPADATRRIRALSLTAMPGAASYMLESQFATFFVAFAGYTTGVADLGALARVGLLLTLPTAFLNKIIQPKLATVAAGHSLVRAWQLTLVFGVSIGALMMGGVWIFGDYLLLLLGPAYAGLKFELLLYAAFQAISFFTSSNGSLLEARGWLKRSWMRPIVVLGSMTCATFFLPITTVSGAIGLMIVGSLGNLLVDGIIIALGFRGRSHVQ